MDKYVASACIDQSSEKKRWEGETRQRNLDIAENKKKARII